MDTKKLRQKILDLAIRGKLVPQDPNDEPASVLLDRIRAEKERLIAEGKIKRPKAKKSTGKSQYQKFTPPFDIPDSWKWVKLDEIGDIVTGYTPSKSDTSNYGCDYPFYKPNDLEQGLNTIKANDNLSAKGMASARVLPIGSVLVTCIGATIGKTGLIRASGASNQQINAIIPNIVVDSEYLYYVIIGEYFQNLIRQNASSTTLPILNKGDFSKLLIPIPPQNEQKRIIDSIKSIFNTISVIDVATSSIKDLVKIAKSKILDLAMQGKLEPQDPADESAADMLRRVNPNAKIITDNPHYPQLPDNWAYLSLSDINSYKSSTVTPANMPEQLFDLYSVPIFSTLMPEKIHGSEIGSAKQVIKKGDVLLCKINPHLNRVWEITKDSDNVQIASSEWIVVRSELYHPSFLKWYFNSPKFRALLSSQVSGVGGSLTRAQPAIVKGYLVPIPPMEEQIRISKAIERWFECLDGIISGLSN